MLSQCQQIKKDYEELRVLKEKFDLELEKAITGAKNTEEADQALTKAKELKTVLEEKRDALEKKLYSIEIVRIGTQRIIDDLNLNLSFKVIEKIVGGEKRFIVKFDFEPRLENITDSNERDKERLDIVKEIVKVLTHRRNKIRGLDVSNKGIGADGAQALAEALQDPNNKLESLDVENNNIGTDGAQALAEALQDPNNKLKSLDVESNNIGADGTQALKSARDRVRKETGREIMM